MFYIKTHFQRCFGTVLIIVSFLGLLCGSMCLFDSFVEQKEQDVDNAYDRIPVTLVVSNITGTQTSQLDISDYLVNYFLSERYVYNGEEQPKAFSSYVRDVAAQATVYYTLLNVSGTAENQKLSGITSVLAATDLSASEQAHITYFDGWDHTLFLSNSNVCIVPDNSYNELCNEGNEGNVLEILVRMSPAATQSESIRLNIVGTYPADSQTIYCPWAVVSSLQILLDGKITADNLSAIVRDNRELDEFREILKRHFAEVSPSGRQEEIDNSPVLRYHPFAITVHDEELRESINSLNRSLQTLRFSRPIFVGIAAILSFISCFYFFFVRRQDLTIMRILGARRLEIIATTLIETVIFCILSIGLGWLTLAICHIGNFPVWTICLIMLASLAGSCTSSLMATGPKGIAMLKEVE